MVADMQVRIECPQCGYVMFVFDEESLHSNRTIRRAYEHALKNPVLCANCNSWVQRPRVERGDADVLPASDDRGAPRPIG